MWRQLAGVIKSRTICVRKEGSRKTEGGRVIGSVGGQDKGKKCGKGEDQKWRSKTKTQR